MAQDQEAYANMPHDENSARAQMRVEELLALYGGDACSTAYVLCDRHEPDAIAYRIVRADLSVDAMTYGELQAESRQFAAALSSLGVMPGDRVATLMGKSRNYLVALMGIWRLGAVHVPLFTAFAPPAIALRLSGSSAKLVICDLTQAAKLKASEHMPDAPPWRVIVSGGAFDGAIRFEDLMSDQLPPVSTSSLGAQAPLIHIYTSGTTGAPKGVVVPARALASFHAYAEFGLDLRPDDQFWCAADPGWAYGLCCGVLASFLTGTPSLVLEGGFSAEITMAVLADHRVTNFAAAPTVYRALRASSAPMPANLRIRCASSAGEPLTPDVNAWAAEALGVEVRDHYGQTESGMMINNHHHPLLRRPIRPGSMGVAMPGWKAIVLDEKRDEPAAPGSIGRIAMDLASSPLAYFSGYHNDAAKSAEKFAGGRRYYLTGDTGAADEDGCFYFSARDDDVIIMAGYRIGPFEVESVIGAHAEVAECAVIGAPDEMRGEVMEAYVVLREGREASAQLGNEIQQWVKDRYAAHAFPRTIHFVQSLPKTPSGKVQRHVLKLNRRAELNTASARPNSHT